MNDYFSFELGGAIGLVAFIAVLINIHLEKKAKARREQASGNASAKA
jgi:hypothetical protein